MLKGIPKKIIKETSVEVPVEAPMGETIPLGKKAEEEESPTSFSVPLAMKNLLEKLEVLEKKDIENQAKLKMLTEVADKGRVFSYESNIKADKKPFKIKLSVFQNGIIVGWRKVKDELVKHPTTGLTVGEHQEYELLILDHEGKTQKTSVSSYPAFSNARYTQRIEADVISKKEDYSGNVSYDVQLPDGRQISIDARFIN